MIAERDRELEREKGQSKLRMQKMENKLLKKKDKMRSMIFDFQEKEQDIERMKEEMESLRSKVKSLNKKIKDERKSKH